MKKANRKQDTGEGDRLQKKNSFNVRGKNHGKVPAQGKGRGRQSPVGIDARLPAPKAQKDEAASIQGKIEARSCG